MSFPLFYIFKYFRFAEIYFYRSQTWTLCEININMYDYFEYDLLNTRSIGKTHSSLNIRILSTSTADNVCSCVNIFFNRALSMFNVLRSSITT